MSNKYQAMDNNLKVIRLYYIFNVGAWYILNEHVYDFMNIQKTKNQYVSI